MDKAIIAWRIRETRRAIKQIKKRMEAQENLINYCNLYNVLVELRESVDRDVDRLTETQPETIVEEAA